MKTNKAAKPRFREGMRDGIVIVRNIEDEREKKEKEKT
jgi:ribosomal protein L35